MADAAAVGRVWAAWVPLRDFADRGAVGAAESTACLIDVASVYVGRHDVSAAATLLDDALRGCPAHAEPERFTALVLRANVARLQGCFGHAGVLLQDALALARDPTRRAIVVNAFGVVAKEAGRLDEAARWYEETLALVGDLPGGRGRPGVPVLHNLAGLRHAQGRFVEAEALILESLRLREAPGWRHVLRGRHRTVEHLSDYGVLAAALAGQGRRDQAQGLFHALICGWADLGCPEHYEVAVCHHHLGTLAVEEGNFMTAAAHYRLS